MPEKVYEEFDSLKNHFEKNNRIRDVAAHNQKIHCLNWNNDGTRIASGSVDKTVSTLILTQDKLVREFSFKGHNDTVDQLAWHPNNPYLLASSSLDKTVRLWDAKSGKALHALSLQNEVISFCWCDDGETIAVCNQENVVNFLDVRTWKLRESSKTFDFEVSEINVNKSNDIFFVTSASGSFYVFDYPKFEHEYSFRGSNTICYCIGFDPTGKHFAIGSVDTVVSIFDFENLACKRTVARFSWPPRTLSFSFDGKLLATGSEDNVIDICHVESGDRVYELRTDEFVYTTAFHPKRYLLAYSCDDKDQRDTMNSIKLFGLKSE